MRDTIVIIGVLFFFSLGGYIVGISHDFCARQALQSRFTEYNVKRLEKQLKDRDRSYKMGQCQNLLLDNK